MPLNRPHRVNCQCPQCTPDNDNEDSSIPWDRLNLWGYKIVSSVLIVISFSLLLVLVAGGAYLYGYQQGTSDGYSWQQFRVIPGPEGDQLGMRATFDTPLVTVTGNYTVGRYDIALVDSLPNRTAGYTTMQNDIVLESGASVYDLYRMCVHEKLHNMAPTSPHQWVYDQADRTVDKTCLTLLYELNSGYYR